MCLTFCPYGGLPQSINSFKFNHTVLMARESPEWGNTVQKGLITAAFQIKWRRCIIHLWRIPCECGSAGKQEVSEVFSLPATMQLVDTPSPAVGTQEKACSIHSHDRTPFKIRCHLFIPNNSIFPVATHKCFLSFPVACHEKHAVVQFRSFSRLEYVITSHHPISKKCSLLLPQFVSFAVTGIPQCTVH